MVLFLVAVAAILGVDLIVRYVGRKHYIPRFSEMQEDASQWNHAFELQAVQRFKPFGLLTQNMARAGLYRVRLYHLIAAILAFAVFGWAVGLYLFVGFIPSLATAAVLASVPIGAVTYARNLREERIFAQMDQICGTLITRTGGAGSQVADALTAFITDTTTRDGRTYHEATLPPPLGPEMLLIYRDVYFNGMPFVAACRASGERVSHPKYTGFMTDLALAAEQGTPGQSLTDFRAGLDSERHLDRFVSEQFSPYIGQAVCVPLIGTAVLLMCRLTLPNGADVLAHPLGQGIFVVAWALGVASIVFMRSQANIDAILLGAEF